MGCLCMEEHAFTKLSIDRYPDSMSMYDTALKLKNCFFHIELGIKLIIIDIWTNKLLKSENLQKSQNAARCCISIHEGVENPFEFLITENVLQGIG